MKEHHAGNRKAVEAVAKHKCFAMEKIFLRKFLPVSSINTKHSSIASQPRSVLNIKFFVQLSFILADAGRARKMRYGGEKPPISTSL